MARTIDLHCKVFVDAHLDRDRLTDTIVQGVNGVRVERHILEAGGAEIFVDNNKDSAAMPHQKSDAPFLYYRYYLDVYPLTGQDLASQITLVSRLLESLWSQGFSAVAACDYEDELPRRGGYNERLPRRAGPST